MQLNVILQAHKDVFLPKNLWWISTLCVIFFLFIIANTSGKRNITILPSHNVKYIRRIVIICILLYTTNHVHHLAGKLLKRKLDVRFNILLLYCGEIPLIIQFSVSIIHKKNMPMLKKWKSSFVTNSGLVLLIVRLSWTLFSEIPQTDCWLLALLPPYPSIALVYPCVVVASLWFARPCGWRSMWGIHR